MKKYIGAICSGVASVFVFITLSLSWLVSSNSLTDTKSTVSGWDLLKDTASVKGYDLFKLSAILMIITAVVLIASVVLIILQNLNVIKIKFSLNKLNVILLSVFAGICILSIIASLVMAGDLGITTELYEHKVNLAFGGWLMLIIACAACATNWVAHVKKIMD